MNLTLFFVNEVQCFFSNEGTRNEVRMRVIERFASENAGEGRDEYESSKYIYYVETLEDGKRIYLLRPAASSKNFDFLYNGFDFLVCVENTNCSATGKGKRNFPKPKDFAVDLAKKKQENPAMYEKFHRLLERVYRCHDIVEKDIDPIHFSFGFSPEYILKTIKWLFIEQDIRNWSYSGRDLIWEVIPRP